MSLYNTTLSPRNLNLTNFYKRYVNIEDPVNESDFDFVESFYNDYLATLKESHAEYSSLNMMNYESLNPILIRSNRMLEEINLLSSWIYSENQNNNSILLMYFNKQELMHKQIVNLIKRIQQKLYTLEQSGNNYRFTFVETFLTLDNIFNLTNKQSLNVDTYSELATLPIVSSTSLKIKDIAIGSSSNGLSGEINSLKNALLDNLIDGSVSTGFSYFKTETGPLILNLIFSLSEESTVNEIRIMPFEILGSADFYIKDILFLSDLVQISNPGTSIKKLLNEKQQSFKIKTNTSESQNIIKFLPVKCSKISIFFEQKNYFKSSTSSLKVYNIGIKDIGFYKTKYIEKGTVESTVISNVENFNSVESWIDIYPRSKSLYNYTLKYTEDNGGQYKQFDFEKNLHKSTLSFLDFNAKDFKYEFELSRNEEGFLTADNYEENISLFNIFCFSRRINSGSSPAYIDFKNVFIEDTLKVAETKIANITSDNNKSLKLGLILPGSNVIDLIFDLKFSLRDFKILISDLLIYCDNILWERVNTLEELEYSKYYLYPDQQRIHIKYTNDPGFKKFNFRIRPKNLILKKINNGFFCELNSAFDYDKNNIRIYQYTNSTQEIDIFPPGDLDGYYSLSKQNITDVTFQLLTSQDGSTFDLVPNRDDFLLDAETGSMQIFSEELRNSFLQCKYYFKDKIEIEKDAFEIYFKEKDALGFFFSDSQINLFREVDVETFYDSRFVRLCRFQKNNYIRGSVSVDSLFGNHYSDIDPDIVYFAKNPKEVDYINGYLEFQSLDHLNEKLNDEYFDENDLFQEDYYKFIFRISRIPFDDQVYNVDALDSRGNLITNLKRTENLTLQNINQTIDPLISKVYYNPESLLCVILVDKRIYSNHSNNFTCRYSSQKNTEQQFFKYSIDYEKCILYTNKPLNSNLKIKALISDLYAEYSLIKYLKKWEYDAADNNIIIQDLDEISNEEKSVKIFYNQNKDGINIEALKEYFSPLLYSINLGFN